MNKWILNNDCAYFFSSLPPEPSNDLKCKISQRRLRSSINFLFTLRYRNKNKNTSFENNFPWPSRRLSRSMLLQPTGPTSTTHRKKSRHTGALVFVSSGAKGERSHCFLGSHTKKRHAHFLGFTVGLTWKSPVEREMSGALVFFCVKAKNLVWRKFIINATFFSSGRRNKNLVSGKVIELFGFSSAD